MRKYLSFLIPLILLSCPVREDPSLNQKIRGEGNRSLVLTAGPERVWVGVPFALTLDMKGDEGDDVVFPEIDRDFLPEGLILKSFKADDNTLTLTVTGEKPGEYAIPPISILFDNGKGDVELLTRPVNLTVESLLAGSAGEMAALSPALRIGFLTLPWALGIGGVVVLAGLLILYLVLRRRKGNLVPPEPAWMVLERDMARIREDHSLLDGDLARLYDLTTSLVRKTLDRVYGETTGEKTREEFIGPLVSSSRYPSETRAWFVKFFERADMVRFARQSGERETALRDLDEALRFAGQGAEKAKSEAEEGS